MGAVFLAEQRDPFPKSSTLGRPELTWHDLTGETPLTAQGQWVGTPEHMSPELASLGNQNLDIR